MKKNCRTLFPMGFGVNKVENGIIVMSFVDIVDDEKDEYEIISSIAMSEEKANEFLQALTEAINSEKNEPTE